MRPINTTLIYVLASLSIPCCCFLGLGILLALPAYIIANNKMKQVEMNPEDFDPDDVRQLNTARTFALVTLIINGLNLLYSIYSIATTDWDVFWEEYQKALEQYQK